MALIIIVNPLEEAWRTPVRLRASPQGELNMDQVLTEEMQKHLFLVLNNISKSMEGLKEDTLKSVSNLEAKVRKLEDKLKEHTHE